ncbi:MAG: aspartate-semialdehyde dehydrogenase [Chlamydiia bacterium]|nr:aspartate-semialdehyde dehydrogenase [Chlamydiia bacterium]
MTSVAIIGASGAVGREILFLLKERAFPLKNVSLFASPRSAGTEIDGHKIETLTDLSRFDLLFFCAGAAVSREWIPKTKGFVVDSSSALRMEDDIPLIIPEINGHVLTRHHRIVSSPNCAATVLLMPLFPVHRLYRVKRIVVSTYQAASGGGAQLQKQLEEETKAHLANTHYPPLFSFPYAFNLYPHNSQLHDSGYVEEERKILYETRKILQDPSIQLTASCVRVPVLRAHSVAANVECHEAVSLSTIEAAWQKMPGLRLFEERALNRFATPADATGLDDVLAGRLRLDMSQPKTIEFWSVGDQLRKGAALNAVQIAEWWMRLKA